MNMSEFEIKHAHLTNLIALKRSFLRLLKKHSTDNCRIESIEQDLEILEKELMLLIQKTKSKVPISNQRPKSENFE